MAAVADIRKIYWCAAKWLVIVNCLVGHLSASVCKHKSYTGKINPVTSQWNTTHCNIRGRWVGVSSSCNSTFTDIDMINCLWLTVISLLIWENWELSQMSAKPYASQEELMKDLIVLCPRRASCGCWVLPIPLSLAARLPQAEFTPTDYVCVLQSSNKLTGRT